jgi:succinate dehydrogenase/fumarate reductase flavoprotein subunit
MDTEEYDTLIQTMDPMRLKKELRERMRVNVGLVRENAELKRAVHALNESRLLGVEPVEADR